MTSQDYKMLADVMGHAFAIAGVRGDENTRSLVYDACYTPLVQALKQENPHFDQTHFSYNAAVAEGKWLEAHDRGDNIGAVRPEWIYKS